MRVTRRALHCISNIVSLFFFFFFFFCNQQFLPFLSFFFFFNNTSTFSCISFFFFFLFYYLFFLFFFNHETNCNRNEAIYIVCAMLIVGQSISNTTDYIVYDYYIVYHRFFLQCFFHRMPSWPRSFLPPCYHRFVFEIHALLNSEVDLQPSNTRRWWYASVRCSRGILKSSARKFFCETLSSQTSLVPNQTHVHAYTDIHTHRIEIIVCILISINTRKFIVVPLFWPTGVTLLFH